MIKQIKIIFIMFFIFTLNLFSKSIDLTELSAYVKYGFSTCDIHTDEIKNGWIHLSPNKGNRSIQIPKLNIKELPKRNFIELRTLPKEDFTIIFFIEFTKEDLERLVSPAIFLERLGQNWEIFWNNYSISNNLTDSEDKTQRGIIIEIPQKILKSGNNVLCIHLKGDPLSTRTGLYYGRSYYIANNKEIYTNLLLDYSLIIFLVCIYFSFGLFNLIFFLKQFENRYHLYFSIFCFLISIYIISRSSILYYFIFLEQDKLSLIEFGTLYLLIPFFGLFYYEILTKFINKIIKIYLYFAIVHGFIFFLMVCFLPSNSYGGILILWQINFPIIITLFIIIVFYIFFKEGNNKNSSIFKSLFNTISGNILIGILFLSLFALFDIYINFKKITAPNISNYGFLIFLSGITFRIANNIFNLMEQIKASEKKYRSLFENSSDIIFLLNQELAILDINQRFEKELNWNKNDFIKKKLTQLFYKHAVEKDPILKNLENYINEELKTKSVLEIQLPLISRGDIPFRYFVGTFQTLALEETREFLLKCAPVRKDPALQFLSKEYQRFIIHSNFEYIEIILPRITEFLNDFLEDREISMIRIALREILINSIEHGNFGITNQEKSKYLEEGSYEQILQEKLNDPNYFNKKVIIEYRLTNNQIIYKITDEGKGFDVKKYLRNIQINNESLHGRGISITKNAFDQIQYNSSGNSVILIKNFIK